MSLGQWIKSLFGIAPKRDVSRLSSGSESAPPERDAGEERIDLSGAPLKEHHRRRTPRDKRLLPKVRSPARQLGLTKRMKVMIVTEAERLFGDTLRTRNRTLRDLLVDEQQLQR